MDNIIFAKYDMDSGFIQAWTEDCNLILIDCDAVEKAIADNMYQRSQLDYLIYNDPMHNGNMPIGYLVVRNYGQSAATINKFNYDFDFSKAYKPEYAIVQNEEFYEIDWLKRFEGDVIAPCQSEICFMDFSQVNKPVNFNVEYTSSGKKYVEKYTVNLTAGSMLKADYRPDDENKALLSIPVLMQEMLKQNL